MVVIRTRIYFVRHAESVYAEGNESSRGLTDKGWSDAEKVKHILRDEPIDALISSPYDRAISTIQSLAAALNKEIELEKDLRERALKGQEIEFTINQFREAKRIVYEDPDYAYPGGESSHEAKTRAVHALEKFIKKYRGQNIVVGTHGDIMTLMLNHWDASYGFEFWKSLTMPDIYRMELEDDQLVQLTRLWE